MNDEPDITINGHRLTESQAMTVRVAIESFALSLTREGLGEDRLGKGITSGYMSRIKEISQVMYHK